MILHSDLECNDCTYVKSIMPLHPNLAFRNLQCAKPSVEKGDDNKEKFDTYFCKSLVEEMTKYF